MCDHVNIELRHGAIVFNTANTILAQGAGLGDVSMLAGFDVDITAQILHDAMVEGDPETRTIRVRDQAYFGAARGMDSNRQPIHGSK